MKFIKAAILAFVTACPSLWGAGSLTVSKAHMYLSPTVTSSVTLSAVMTLAKEPFTPGQCSNPTSSITVINTGTSAMVNTLTGDWFSTNSVSWSKDSGTFSFSGTSSESITWTISLPPGNYDIQFMGQMTMGGGGSMEMDWSAESEYGAPTTNFPAQGSVTVDGTVSGGIVSDGPQTIHFKSHDPEGAVSWIRTQSWNQTYGYTIEWATTYSGLSGMDVDIARVQTLTPGNWYFWTDTADNVGGGITGPGAWASGFLLQVVGNGSAFVSQSVPAAVYVSQTFSVSQTWTNTGTTTWVSP